MVGRVPYLLMVMLSPVSETSFELHDLFTLRGFLTRVQITKKYVIGTFLTSNACQTCYYSPIKSETKAIALPKA